MNLFSPIFLKYLSLIDESSLKLDTKSIFKNVVLMDLSLISFMSYAIRN